ncbi:MAG: hypothetical protein ACKO4Z_01760 [Planctomycetota bacterium]
MHADDEPGQILVVHPDDLSRVNQAFFSANALIGMILLAAVAVDLWA